jgi:hypothetical protein
MILNVLAVDALLNFTSFYNLKSRVNHVATTTIGSANLDTPSYYGIVKGGS